MFCSGPLSERARAQKPPPPRFGRTLWRRSARRARPGLEAWMCGCQGTTREAARALRARARRRRPQGGLDLQHCIIYPTPGLTARRPAQHTTPHCAGANGCEQRDSARERTESSPRLAFNSCDKTLLLTLHRHHHHQIIFLCVCVCARAQKKASRLAGEKKQRRQRSNSARALARKEARLFQRWRRRRWAPNPPLRLSQALWDRRQRGRQRHADRHDDLCVVCDACVFVCALCERGWGGRERSAAAARNRETHLSLTHISRTEALAHAKVGVDDVGVAEQQDVLGFSLGFGGGGVRDEGRALRPKPRATRRPPPPSQKTNTNGAHSALTPT